MINSLPKSLIETAKKILTESTHPMIDVDGNQKHRHNSEGRPIHPTDDGIRNFHRWFGNSVTVDEHGRPKVYYHGTSKDFSKFDPKKSFTGIGGSFFSPDKKFADSYDYHHNVGTVMPVYIKAINIFDLHNNKHRDILQKYMGENTYYNNFVGGKRPMSEKFPESRDYVHMEHPLVINAIKDLKHDSFLVDERGTSNIAVFNPKNVKSALGNSGDFGKTSSLTEEHKESKEPRLPFADISHHHHRKHLNEGKIEDWVNHKQPYDQQVNNFNFDTSIDSIRPKTYAAEDTHKDLADDHLSNLDGHHREAVESYIMGGLEDGDETGSFRVNDHLIKSHRAKKEPKKEFHFGSDEDFQRYLNIDHLDEALEINKLEKPLTTYSGIGFNPKDIMKGGNMLHLPAYTSSSTNRGVAVLYAKPDKDRVYHVMQIHHPTGSSGLYIGDRDDFSPFMQKEHLMPRGTTLKINPKPEVHTDNLGVQMHIWKATRVLDKDTK